MAQANERPHSLMSQLANGTQYRPEDSFVAVMGVTGAGKSTFISRLAGDGAKVGHDLVSCTRDIESFSFRYNDSTIHLIDTPGFDDTYRTDSDVLKDIVFWLNAAYQRQIRLSGIVYLHPIDKNRMTGSAYKNLRMFQKLCGDASLQSVVLATTMWKNIDEVDGIKRQEQLKTQPDFWGDMVHQGSRVFRHDDSRASAMNIVTYILDQRRTTVLQIQRQMVDEGKTLDETSAGQELERELIKQRKLFERRLQEAQDDMKEAIEEGNRKSIEDAAAQQERFQNKLNEAIKGSDDLRVSMEELLQKKDAEFKRVLENVELEKSRSQEEAKLVTQQMQELDLKVKASQAETEDQRRRHQSEIDEMSIRLAKESNDNQVTYQEWLSVERARLGDQSDRSSFREAFDGQTGVAMGQAVGAAVATGTMILGTVAAAACNVM
ncbi:hypothetical protein LTS16_002045 [Friedmanniomyces endolithicus]|uniref:G domain-containing protein n=1 Tax=Friedmanniomyces endolithicus TaxID=329885 RepID=A0A4U0V2H1_9PEZI|nr:hypothetical protein LTS09_007169 [Friedmanniomyces endolithicus]KAK0315622.1 hypothetical protein LTR01_000922 [Friedmanniomyces endolithicus]KAK0835981.1 hypothetical protein LTR73_000482 [Friedmanniomyces endolithicus]KAK1052365.1 hypothetical protein LTS16_002045 [Friedmanniomyces endolithicus]TKA42821.1 hypothetical protein B0A54_07037 [Friedmanniomyces endolithicus]